MFPSLYMFVLVGGKDCCRRTSIFSNKVMKAGFINKMETIWVEHSKVKHDALAGEVSVVLCCLSCFLDVYS